MKITAETPNDVRWGQTVAVRPHTLYRVSGWVKIGHLPGAKGEVLIDEVQTVINQLKN